MRGKFGRFLIEMATPPMRALGFVVGNLYSLLFGWYDKRLAREQQRRLEQEVRNVLQFLFSEHHARMLPGKPVRRLADIGWPTVSLTAEGVILHLVRWRSELNASVAPAHAPQDSHELLLVLTLLDPESDIRRNWTLYSPASVARLLEPRMDLIRKAFSEEGYPEFRKQLAEVEDYDRIVTRQFEAKLNWRLYGR